MSRRAPRLRSALRAVLLAGAAGAASAQVPTDVQLPGTQPLEVGGLESPAKCDNCHGGYDAAVEPAHAWRGGPMAQAARDPIFWASVAVAERDFAGVGDLCLRCHTPDGWLAGRSTPTDGSGLGASDAFGVSCDSCHKLTNPDRTELLGVQNAPFVAYEEGAPPEAYRGSGMYVMWGGAEKLGPYLDVAPPHSAMRSRFHRDAALCGTCHDVSNPAVGDLAHNHGSATPLPAGSWSGVPGSPVAGKAAFNNPPYRYGMVERTYSEHVASGLSTLRVSDYSTLPAELRAGAIRSAYEAALAAGNGGDYEDGADRYFSCQSCHMPPVTGQGCNKNPPVRDDLPLHDQTGGNAWLADWIVWLDDRDQLRLGGGLTAGEKTALVAGQARARASLARAAALEVAGDTLRVVNRTGHKLPTGYPEGRRMWLNVRWYDQPSGGALLREDGAYGALAVTIDGQPASVSTLLDLGGARSRVYEAHLGMTREWAAQLVALGYPLDLPLGFDRVSGEPTTTLGELAAAPAGTVEETFHFVLNNAVIADSRIPPWRMSRAVATARNATPVPASLYGDPAPGGVYRYWDEVALDPPTGAKRASIRLLYQATSWEYVRFLAQAGAGASDFLALEGERFLAAWRATGMAEPFVMAEAAWTAGVAEIAIFDDDFESGDTCDWTLRAGSSDLCDD